MPLDADTTDRFARLNRRFGDADAPAILQEVLGDARYGRLALVSSFGAESAVLLHMVARIAPETPVLFLDTGMLFAETLTYQQDLVARLGLRDVRRIRPAPEATGRADPGGTLYATDPDACCALRKVAPLEQALSGFQGWISGRKRFQGGARLALEPFEPDSGGRIKINPLARWSAERLRAYMDEHALPRHPLVRQGYPSIGCAPCTSRVAPGEDLRAGRWRGTGKRECGIHLRVATQAPTAAIRSEGGAA